MVVRSNGRCTARLNPGQIECMLLVGDHLTSKEIAQRLGISPHTVDQRIRGVLRATGTTSRRQAAQLIKERSDSSPVCPTGMTDPGAAAAGEQPIVATTRPESLWLGLTLPFATHPGQVNRMVAGQRLFWIVMIALGASASTMMYLAGLESLARLLR